MTTTDATKDPRCPYCERPVLGTYVQGVEGRYHAKCVEPPNVTTHAVGALSVSQENAPIHVAVSGPAKHELTEDDSALQEEFLGLLAGRLKAGAVDYGNASFDAPLPETFGEVMEEVLDVSGWAYVMWVHLKKRLHVVLAPAAKVEAAMQLIKALDAYEFYKEQGHAATSLWTKVLECRTHYDATKNRAEEVREMMTRVSDAAPESDGAFHEGCSPKS